MDSNIILAFLFSFIAGSSTILGSLVAFFIKDVSPSSRFLPVCMGFSAGVMIQISFMELLFSAIIEVGLIYSNISFFLGIVFIAFIDFLIPHEYKDEYRSNIEKNNQKLMKTGFLVSIGIAIHNFPEGIVTLFGTIKNPKIGLMLLIAIALHNIPEGISISLPIYYATKSRKRAFAWSFFSGFSELIGAVIGFFFLFPFINPFIISLSLAFVAGIMVFISFDELLPTSLSNGHEHIAITSLFLGMGMMTLILLILK